MWARAIARSEADAHADQHGHPGAHCNFYFDGDTNCDSYGYINADSHTDSHTDSYTGIRSGGCCNTLRPLSATSGRRVLQQPPDRMPV